MVNISTDMWEIEISETHELKLNLCCLKSRFGTKRNSWRRNWYKILITNCHRYFSQISYHEYFSQSLALQVCYKYCMR